MVTYWSPKPKLEVQFFPLQPVKYIEHVITVQCLEDYIIVLFISECSAVGSTRVLGT